MSSEPLLAEPLLPAQHLDDPGLPEQPFGSREPCEVPISHEVEEDGHDGSPETSHAYPEDSPEAKALYLELNWMKAIYFLGCLGGTCWGRFAQVSLSSCDARIAGRNQSPKLLV